MNPYYEQLHAKCWTIETLFACPNQLCSTKGMFLLSFKIFFGQLSLDRDCFKIFNAKMKSIQ